MRKCSMATLTPPKPTVSWKHLVLVLLHSFLSATCGSLLWSRADPEYGAGSAEFRFPETLRLFTRPCPEAAELQNNSALPAHPFDERGCGWKRVHPGRSHWWRRCACRRVPTRGVPMKTSDSAG